MKILFVGVFSEFFSTNIAQARGLKNIGHEVIEYDYREELKKTKSWLYNREFNKIVQERDKHGALYSYLLILLIHTPQHLYT